MLVFVDATNPALRGYPGQRRLDKLLRAKAKMKGYQVVEITAEALKTRVAWPCTSRSWRFIWAGGRRV